MKTVEERTRLACGVRALAEHTHRTARAPTGAAEAAALAQRYRGTDGRTSMAWSVESARPASGTNESQWRTARPGWLEIVHAQPSFLDELAVALASACGLRKDGFDPWRRCCCTNDKP